MKQFAILALSLLLAIGLLACGADTSEPTDTATPAASSGQATAVPAEPTNTPPPEPTAVPANTPYPTPAPAPTSTPVLEPTATHEPAAPPTPEPDPTTTPTQAPTPDPEPTNAPTTAPEPAATEAPALPIAADLAPLGDNLLFVAYFDGATQTWSVYDASGTFSPDQLPLPPGQTTPDAADIGEITELVLGEIYTFLMREGQTAVLNGTSMTFYPRVNQLLWK